MPSTEKTGFFFSFFYGPTLHLPASASPPRRGAGFGIQILQAPKGRGSAPCPRGTFTRLSPAWLGWTRAPLVLAKGAHRAAAAQGLFN